MLKTLFAAATVLALTAPVATAQVDLRFGREGPRVHVPNPFYNNHERHPRCPAGYHMVQVQDDRGFHFECVVDRDGYRNRYY